MPERAPELKLRPTTRFAPAPTGYLHVGHVLNAIYVWGVAQAIGARVLLRIEDHDRQRSRPEYERALVEDLQWLGFEPAGTSRQSDRDAIYEAALAGLRDAGLLYACDCSRKQIGAARYPGTCRNRGLEEAPGRGIRVRIGEGTETFDDLLIGRQTQSPAGQAGDVLLRDRHGIWTYQFAATVDDHAQGVTHVIRGDDLLDSTGRQLRIARLIGRADPPVFLHHPLIMKTPEQKISKSDADTGIRELRAGGWSAARVIGFTAALAGLIPAPLDLTVSDLTELVFTHG
ncbi:MAG TPA: glutamate--tRNA ligase family protein [Vicinamibacterales bacterium]|nr:glutamate--tRNA ligase family protein [Vicinamibacterales bacterium]